MIEKYLVDGKYSPSLSEKVRADISRDLTTYEWGHRSRRHLELLENPLQIFQRKNLTYENSVKNKECLSR